LLFNIVLEIAIQRSNIGTQGTIFNKCSQIMAYTDDIVIMGRRIQDVKEMFTALIEQMRKLGLEINNKKKDYICDSIKKTISRKSTDRNRNLQL
jgi:sorting nexin-29